MEERQQLKIACLEEIALFKSWIGPSDVAALADSYGGSPYGAYLRRLLKSK